MLASAAMILDFLIAFWVITVGLRGRPPPGRRMQVGGRQDRHVARGREHEGRAVGVSGTPTFIIGNERLVGAQPFTNVQPVIDRQLN